MPISFYSGTVRSGKSYHALEDIIARLNKKKHVIANFPLYFRKNQIEKGIHKYYMYLPDEKFNSLEGISNLIDISIEHGFKGREGSCLLVIDECHNFFPSSESSTAYQKAWHKFFTQSGKLGYDIILITQDVQAVGRTIRKCVEYNVIHRKANNIFPFKYLPFTLFIYITYWYQNKTKLSQSSSIFVKKLADLYDSYKLFADLGTGNAAKTGKQLPKFGNCVDANDEDVVITNDTLEKAGVQADDDVILLPQ